MAVSLDSASLCKKILEQVSSKMPLFFGKQSVIAGVYGHPNRYTGVEEAVWRFPGLRAISRLG